MSHLHGIRKLYHELEDLEETIITCSGLVEESKEEVDPIQLNILRHDLENLLVQKQNLLHLIDLHKK